MHCLLGGSRVCLQTSKDFFFWLQERGQSLPQAPDSYYHVIRGDKEHVINIVMHLVEGLATASAPIQACIEHFEKR